MHLSTQQKKIYELAQDMKNNGFCIHDVMETLGMRQTDASARVNELLGKGLITKMFIKYTCRNSDKRHTFYGVNKTPEKIKEQEQKKMKPNETTITPEQTSQLNDLKKSLKSEEEKVEKLERKVEDLKETITFQDDETQKLQKLVIKLRHKVEVLKELYREEVNIKG